MPNAPNTTVTTTSKSFVKVSTDSSHRLSIGTSLLEHPSLHTQK